ncbi:3-methyladenine DNA glycosylase/8-oxoguanine DNA glycosylase [Allokutzneria albata]|uniref:DNA-3-methyladenine glycosylase II n=1 Tax=Allokutzneria albata TaxID=211114 RepID=A0A1H0BEG6_ALLAB|nr:3-methyladenine DNA glycosylase/8-oxoguanine DNA glycosylase [Allokutzneria albata]
MLRVRAAGAVETEWLPGFEVDPVVVLRPHRRGNGDPAWKLDARGTVWRACTTPAGTATLAVRRAGAHVRARAWGPGAEWVIDGLPDLLGASDDDSGFVAHHRLVAEARALRPDLRLGSTRRVWDALVPAILEQKVTGKEAWRTWRELCTRFGEPAPGPVPERMSAPPTPERVRAIPDWEWHRAGLDGARRRALLAAASVADRLERAAELRGVRGRDLLRRIPGIGVWTAAEVAQRAWGDPDAVSFGDFHLAKVVGWALLGHDIDDAQLHELLEPYAPQRQRAIRYLEGAGVRRPRFGPRYSPRDYRAF